MNLRRALHEARFALLLQVRRPSDAAVALAYPFIYLALLGTVFGSQGTPPVYLADHDHSARSQALDAAIATDGAVKADVVPATLQESLVSSWMDAHAGAPVIWIPEGYSHGTNASQVRIYVSAYGQASRVVWDVVAAAERSVAGNASLLPATLPAGKPPAPEQLVSYQDRLFAGMVGLLFASFGMTRTAVAAVGFRVTGVFRRFASMPLKPSEWMLGRFLVATALAVLGSELLAVVAHLLYGTPLHLNLAAACAVLAGGLAMTALGALIGGAIRNAGTSQGVSQLVFFAMFFGSGLFLPLERLPVWMRWVAEALPLTHFNRAITRAVVAGHPDLAWADIGLLALFALACFAVTAKVLRWSEE